jgi:hypothetical protein
LSTERKTPSPPKEEVVEPEVVAPVETKRKASDIPPTFVEVYQDMVREKLA